MRQRRLVVLKPVLPRDHGPSSQLLMVLSGAVVALGIGLCKDKGGILVGFGAIFGGIAWIIGRSSKQNLSSAASESASWLDGVQKTTDEFNSAEALLVADCPLPLQKAETCHWADEASWYEFRSVTKRVDYHGLTASIPIAKGLRYCLGSIAPTIQRETELVPIDHSQLYITNKRILFDGGQKNTTLTWNGLTQVQLFDGGIILEKNTGKSPHLMIRRGATEAALTVAAHL